MHRNEHREEPRGLADLLLPFAMIDDGILLQQDGSLRHACLTQSERNVPNAPENIARMKREKIVTYYSVLNSGMNRLMIGDSERYQFPQRHICIRYKSN